MGSAWPRLAWLFVMCPACRLERAFVPGTPVYVMCSHCGSRINVQRNLIAR